MNILALRRGDRIALGMGMLCAVLLGAALFAQDTGVFYPVQSKLVLVPVTVTDAKGRAVEGLGAEDFELLDSGKPREIDVDSFATGVAPVALVVAVQASGISYPVLLKVRKIGAMIQPLITGERGCASLLSFAEELEWLAECTRSPDELARAFAKLRPREQKSGRMLDAASQAIARLEQRSDARRILLLISESRDRGSETGLDAVLQDAQKAGVTVYAATYSAFKTAFTTRPSDTSQPEVTKGPGTPRPEAGSPPGREHIPIPPPEQRADILGGLGELTRLGQENAARVLTESTGGAVFGFARQKGLEDAIEKLGREIHTQYMLSFVPASGTPGFRRIEVRLKRPGRYRVRARSGYWVGGGTGTRDP